MAVFDNRILLLYRAVGNDHVSRFGVATSRDGVHFNYAGNEPVFGPDPESKYESQGVEDSRITYMGDRYAVVYVAASVNDAVANGTDWKTRVSLAFTSDFRHFERRGVILHSYNDKNAALFPVTWDGWYYLFHRRHPSIWLSKTRDFNTWEDVCDAGCMIIQPNPRGWDSDRIGIASPPLHTADGWLVFYHGRDTRGIYRLGAFLADFRQPELVIAKLPYPLLEPELPFEITGPIPNVVFACGAVEVGDDYFVYYGGADYAIGGATINKRQLLTELKRHRETGN